MAKKIISKSGKGSVSQLRQSGYNSSSQPNVYHPQPHRTLGGGGGAQQQHSWPPGVRGPAASSSVAAVRVFNGSENDLSLGHNSMLRPSFQQYPPVDRYCYSPPVLARSSSPEQVKMYKTRVIYHSRQDCAATDQEASV